MILIHFITVSLTLAINLLVAYALLKKKLWTGLSVLMFNSILVGVAYTIAILFVGLYRDSLVAWECSIFLGVYSFFSSAALCCLHMYIIWTMRLVNVLKAFAYVGEYRIALVAAVWEQLPPKLVTLSKANSFGFDRNRF